MKIGSANGNVATCLIKAPTKAFMHVVLISIPEASSQAQTCTQWKGFRAQLLACRAIPYSYATRRPCTGTCLTAATSPVSLAAVIRVPNVAMLGRTPRATIV